MSARDEVLIIGAGVIGLSIAYYLLKRGRPVRLIDQGEIGRGASWGNCGYLSPSQAPPLAAPGLVPKAFDMMWRKDAPLYIKPTLNPTRLRWLLGFARRCNERDYRTSARIKSALLNRSRELIDQIIRSESIDCDYAPIGHLVAYRTQAAIDASALKRSVLSELGVPYQLLDAKAAQALEPALHPDVIGVLYTETDAHLRPDRYVAGLAAAVKRMGGVIETGIAALEFLRSGDVLTTTGEYRAKQMVIALGAWSPKLARSAGLRVPIEPAKGYSITMSRPQSPPRLSVVGSERGVAITPWQSGYRIGSTYEFSGFDRRPNRLRFDALKIGAAEYLRDPFGAETHEEWFGFRPMTIDGIPYLCEARPGVWLACGHGTLGLSMSAGSGELMAELLCAAPTTLAPDGFRLARFRSNSPRAA
jgi:D-amino-acid dehydrogenase